MAEEKKYLGTAAVERLIANTRTEIEAAKTAAKNYADSLADNYDAAGTAQTKVNELATGAVKTNTDHIGTMANLDTTAKSDLVSAVNEVLETAESKVNDLANGAVKTNTEHIGTMGNLETTAKGDLVTAINEVRNAVSAGGTASAMTMEEKTTGLGDGIAKAYVLKQGTNTVGTINIPKDMVVQSGEVVTNPAGQAEGTYIKLVLANATNDIIYVNVGNLVDIYKAKASATQVQLAIDSATREISATIVAGSVTATELAADAVTTVKIADGNVTKAKLSTDVQASLDKADAAAQGASDAAAQALSDAKSYVDGKDSAMGTRVKALEDKNSPTRTEWNEEIAAIDQALSALSQGIEQATSPLNERLIELEKIDHDHTNKTQLDTYDKTQTELLAAAKSEAEGMLNELYTTVSGDMTVFDERIDALEAIDHEHANATQLATYDKTQTELLDAAKTNAADTGAVVLSEAQSYADGLNTAMNTRVEALESISYVEITADEIDAMFDAE